MSARSEQLERLLSWVMLGIGVIGFLITFPLWLLDLLSDRAMLGITLALSWAALWYAALLAIQAARHARKRTDGG